MQTFLPHESFTESARVLDTKRLGKQRSETLMALQAIVYGSTWDNHPVVRMWRSYRNALALYGREICLEWVRRGYRDNCLRRIEVFYIPELGTPMPSWLGRADFHANHRAVLLAKNYEWYSRFNWQEQPVGMLDGRWPYIWPA